MRTNENEIKQPDSENHIAQIIPCFNKITACKYQDQQFTNMARLITNAGKKFLPYYPKVLG